VHAHLKQIIKSVEIPHTTFIYHAIVSIAFKNKSKNKKNQKYNIRKSKKTNLGKIWWKTKMEIFHL